MVVCLGFQLLSAQARLEVEEVQEKIIDHKGIQDVNQLNRFHQLELEDSNKKFYKEVCKFLMLDSIYQVTVKLNLLP